MENKDNLEQREHDIDQRVNDFSLLLFIIALIMLIILIITSFIDKMKPSAVPENFYELTELNGKMYIHDHGIWGGLLEYEH